jgi:hypothetical protein
MKGRGTREQRSPGHRQRQHHGGACGVATNSPINDWVALHSKMAPYRTYAMAFTLPRGSLPDALYWDMPTLIITFGSIPAPAALTI